MVILTLQVEFYFILVDRASRTQGLIKWIMANLYYKYFIIQFDHSCFSRASLFNLHYKYFIHYIMWGCLTIHVLRELLSLIPQIFMAQHYFSFLVGILACTWDIHFLGMTTLHDPHLFKIFPRHSCPQKHYTILTSLKYFHAIHAHKNTTRSSPLYIFIFKVDQHTKPIGKSKSKLQEHVPQQKKQNIQARTRTLSSIKPVDF